MTLDHLNTTPMPPDQPPEDGLPMTARRRPPVSRPRKTPWLLPAIPCGSNGGAGDRSGGVDRRGKRLAAPRRGRL